MHNCKRIPSMQGRLGNRSTKLSEVYTVDVIMLGKLRRLCELMSTGLYL